jgi:hypothetical protein
VEVFLKEMMGIEEIEEELSRERELFKPPRNEEKLFMLFENLIAMKQSF